MLLQAIYTEKNNCQDCYKCIRHCPVKAIKIEEHCASIVSSLCINCGVCVQVCPANAKKVRNDLITAKFLLKTHRKVILSLAPSYKSEFTDYTSRQLLDALHRIGFYEVSETALGAELVSKATKEWLAEQPNGIYYSSCCPAVVSLIQKYYPDQLPGVAPVVSPMQAHAKFIKKTYGEDTIVVFAGPCIAKKQEVNDYQGGADLALTFNELREWLKENGLTPDFLSEENEYSFAPFGAEYANLYPIEGGMIATLKSHVTITDITMMSFSGLRNVKEILEQHPVCYDGKLFIELMSCEGGCVNGPLVSNPTSTVEKRIVTITQTPDTTTHNNELEAAGINLSSDYRTVRPVERYIHSPEEIEDALRSVGKISEKDEINCGGCGYESCRRFAEAILEGKAQRNMCVSYMRRVAQNKATVLLQKMPYGVVLVDDKLQIIETNQNFARVLGDSAMEIYSVKPGMEGADLAKLTPLHKLFANSLEKGLAEFNKDVRMNNGIYHLSIFSIQPFKIVCGIIHPLGENQLSRSGLTERLRQVISENLSTAQKAALILGENASRTETMLHNIIDSYQPDEDD
ncbi:MAG: [Fe-Fe] hydrogenase large subunit C-terminal domain-containing protein [Bacteroidales bacterium]|jgi:iron only hydrogenase large subunit-like protein|nr:[Fe-Fe] hydrogenase large subunit C-terminal domain-containing protein [Bacteroidales bacterium]